ncbi:MAG: FecR domain-containing protein [Bacteroidota bacterium]|nr:FecR domain-containing protein [Bacteroidota bacterium]
MEQNRLDTLFNKYHEGTLSPLEKQELDDWFHGLNLGKPDFNIWITKEGGGESYSDQRFQMLKQQIVSNQKSARIIPMRWLAAAASILIIITTGIYFLRPAKHIQALVFKNKPVLLPGLNNATITLSNGKKVTLYTGEKGLIAKEANVSVQMDSNGTISYAGKNENHLLAYNKINTPRGGHTTTIKLPDGSLAILDASSSIKYLVSFAKNERRIEVTGQVYFEVVHDVARPFRVTAAGQTVEDLGTHFNINAYSDEPEMKVTLEQGRVKIMKGDKSVILVPGQQSLTDYITGTMSIKNVDTGEELSWINGKILFGSKNIQQIMRQVSRWYDLDVEYQGIVPKQTFTGGITKSDDLSNMLKILELNGIKCEISGRKLIIKP